MTTRRVGLLGLGAAAGAAGVLLAEVVAYAYAVRKIAQKVLG